MNVEQRHDAVACTRRAGTNVGSRVGRRSFGPFTLVSLAVVLALAPSCDDDGLVSANGALQVRQLVDFGAVPLTRERVERFEVLNAGRAPVVIDRITFEQPSPGDFELDAPQNVVLSPGERLELTVRFTPRTLGLRAARLLLPNDSPRSPDASVEVRGLGVLAKADLSSRHLDFGRVAMGTLSTLTLELTNTETHRAEVELAPNAGNDPLDFRVQPQGVAFVEPGGTLLVSVTFAPQRLGPHGARFDIKTCPSCAFETVTLAGEGIAASLVAQPNPVDFGFVEPRQTAVRQVQVTNLGTQDVTLESVEIGEQSGPGFSVEPLAHPVVLGEGESYSVEVRFTPMTLDPQSGSLRLNHSAEGRVLSVALTGFGGGPDIEVDPMPALSFPKTAVGAQVVKRIRISNVGYDPTGTRPLRVDLSSLFISSDTGHAAHFRWQSENQSLTEFVLQPGQAKNINITYWPLSEGSHEAFIDIPSNDGDEPVVRVALRGSAKTLGPCEYTVTPEVVNFGIVPEGVRARLAFGVRNVGANTCAISNVRLSPGTPAAFGLTYVSTRMFEPGETLIFPVEFEAPTAGDYSGMAQFDITSPVAPKVDVPLLARAMSPCLEIEPPVVDFNSVGLACQPPTRPVIARNACNMAVDLRQVFIGTSTTDEFEITSGGPTLLQPGQSMQVDVTYRPRDEGEDLAPLFFDTTVAAQPLMSSLQARASLRPTQVDTFVQPPRLQVDFLFIVDNSGSLMEEQDALSRNFDRFIQSANARGVDYHIAVTTTGLTPYKGGWSDCPGGVDGGEAGRFFPVDNSRPRILTPTTPNLRSHFAANVKVGVCHWWEEGLEASRLALSEPLVSSADDPRTPQPNDGNAGFLRPEAKLYVLYVSDEEDSGTQPVETYINFLRGLKPGRPDLVSASAIVGLPSCATAPSVGSRYMQVASALGGMVADICSPDWGGLLQRIGDDAFAARTVFPLTQAPDGRDVSVRVDGLEVSQTDSNGRTQWRYDPTIGDYGAVVFEPGVAPGPNTTLEIIYPVPCPETIVP